MQPRTETSTKCSSQSQGISGVSTFSDPCKKSTGASKKSSSSRERVLKEFLQPMTYSEIEYQNHQIINHQEQKNVDKLKQNKNSDHGSTITQISASKQNLPLLDFVRKEKQSQLNWIEKEILHLSNLRDLLAKNVDTSAITTMRHEHIQTSIENKSFVINNKDSKSEESKKLKMNDNMVKRQKTQTEYSTQSNTSNKDTSNEKPKKGIKSGRFMDWDSHTNLKKIMKNRSRLETPSETDESIVSFINKRKEQFLEKYDKKKKQERQDDEELYTKPYSSRATGDTEHYSEPIEKRNRHQQNPFSCIKNSPIINASTSLASSEVFVSSQSISIPVVNSTNNTTTHHYDLNGIQSKNKYITVISFGTQTTDSIAKTKPIFERKLKENDQIINSSTVVNTLSNTHTKRVDQTRNHKQMQTSPKSIKYMLTFDHQNKISVDRKFSSLPQTEIMSELKNSKDFYNRINSNSLDNKKVNDLESERVSDKTEMFMQQEDIVLENYLNRKRPDIWHKFEERKRCILQLKTLR